MVPLVAALAIGPLMPWKKADLAGVFQRLKLAGLGVALVVAAVLALKGVKPALAPLGMAMAGWCVFGALAEPLTLGRSGLLRWPRRNWGRTLAHAGLGICIAGMTVSALWMQESISLIHPGDTTSVAGYTLLFKGVIPVAGENYTAIEGDFLVSRHGRTLADMHPQRRFYPVQSRFTTQAAIRTDLAADLYVTIGAVDAHDPSAYVTRIYHHPLVPWIWMGALMMMAGGVVSLPGRRHTMPDLLVDPGQRVME